MTTTDTDTARDQAIAQLESIQAMIARLEHVQTCDGDIVTCAPDFRNILESLNLSKDHVVTVKDNDDYHDEDEARERIVESPLSILVRSGWHETDKIRDFICPVEFEILLCTGGPAVRITGELDEYSQPTRARLQYQDWGTPWTELLEPRDSKALISYASNFYFGE